jgi:hypothetical protein
MSTGGGEEDFVNAYEEEFVRVPPATEKISPDVAENKQTDGKPVGELHAINFKDDWSGDVSMPDCAERTLALVVRYLDCLKMGRQVDKYKKQLEVDYRQQDPKNLQPLEMRMVQCLIDQARRERFPEYQVSLMRNALDAVQKHNLEQGVETLRQIMKSTRKFDIDVALKIIDECSRVAELFKGKDVFLVIGATGAGN